MTRWTSLPAAVMLAAVIVVSATGCSGSSPTKAAASPGGTSTTAAGVVVSGGAATTATTAAGAPTSRPPSTQQTVAGPPTSVSQTPAITALPPAGATTLPVPSTATTAASPTLRIVSPRAGDSVAAPFPVQYAVSGFTVGPKAGGLQITLGDGGVFAATVALDGPAGVFYLDDIRLSGFRTLVFTLTNADGRALTNPEATVVVPNVTIAGRK